MEIRPIAHIRTEFPEKFGIPRQSGLAESLSGKIVFEKEFRNIDSLRGLEEFSHLWMIWEFSANRHAEWQPTVRPPRLGGNAHMGVFATRSPYRPNPIGLSCVEITSIDPDTPDGPVIYVKGADLMDGTPIYDIKPYIRYADSRPEAVCGYVDELSERKLKVKISAELVAKVTDDDVLAALVETLSLDPRPSYHNDPHREYGLSFAGYNVKFVVCADILNVIEIENEGL
ncbi:MAG: tRNA (N6-threonylcarbamoyladenosine(37)-N6)-methyltransferase TrmO [Bacteroidales bacterium]|nr:tRNA (N6-threonylcarbamoyladenosine(37)-N6)-methyltransferase TrmO [Bacteroidales bacterium]